MTLGRCALVLTAVLAAAGCDLPTPGTSYGSTRDVGEPPFDVTGLPPGLHVLSVDLAEGRALPGQSWTYGSGNGDGVANRGETVGLRLTLFNNTREELPNLRATLRLPAQSPCVANLPTNTASFGTLLPRETTDPTGNALFSVELTTTCAPPSTVVFALDVEDDDGRNWPLTVTLDVLPTGAALTLGEVEVADGRALPGSSWPYGSGNGDGAVNRGETVGLRLHVFNSGRAGTERVTARLSSTDACVHIAEDEGSLGDVPPGSGELEADDIDFALDVASTCGGPGELVFAVVLTDAYGNEWTDTFSLPLARIAVAIAVASVEIADGRTLTGSSYPRGSGDGDGLAERTETVALRVTLRNTGTSGTQGIVGSLGTSNACVEIPLDDASFGDVLPGGTTAADATPHFEVRLGDACEGALPLVLGLADRYGNAYEAPLVLDVR